MATYEGRGEPTLFAARALQPPHSLSNIDRRRARAHDIRGQAYILLPPFWRVPYAPLHSSSFCQTCSERSELNPRLSLLHLRGQASQSRPTAARLDPKLFCIPSKLFRTADPGSHAGIRRC